MRRPWRPIATYAFLGAMGGTYILQLIFANTAGGLHRTLFVIDDDFYLRPWTLLTSTFAHGSPAHLFLNGLVLFFFGPNLERVWTRRAYVAWFLAAGAVAGVAQVLISEALHPGSPGALGASGAIMMVMGALTVLTPKAQILLWFVLPIPFWVFTIGYAFLELVGVFNPYSNVGHVAHLGGLALGLYLGWRTRERMRHQGVRLVYS